MTARDHRPRRAPAPSALRRPRLPLLALLLLLLIPLADAARVERLRVHAAPDHTRVVLDLSGPARFEDFTLTGPDRVVIDLEASQSALPGLPRLDDSRIKAIRTAPRNGSDLRVVLELDEALRPNVFSLAPISNYGHRLVVDLYEPEAARAAPAVPAMSTPQDAGARRDVVVVIDAGHGGEDPGALGPGGVREKDVVMAIARRLDALFDDAPGFRGELVRDGDYYVPLRGRTQRARSLAADLFVSVHADAFRTAQPRGASVYALSRRGATSEMARWLQQSEQQSDLIGGVGDLSGRDPVLAEVLLDISMDGTLRLSMDAGERVLSHLGETKRLHSRTLHQAGFVVLKSPDIPSILVETGFISNPREARELASAEHQARIARAVFEGVREHLELAPPPGTLLAWRRDNPAAEQRYTIVEGDTLSGIAERFGVRTVRLKRANDLASDAIRVGQVLVIPTS